MHYNLHERLKPKKYVPYKKLALVMIGAIILVLVYIFLIRGGSTPAPVVNKPA